ncbi:V-type proton ATPase 116 kDa subunit a-like isoform X2 [Varroa jacobsoni]|uniref:V-type proton ATPase subunit a n=1 Tax=Varroa destructor TaxID=109461 RepID=A0A7M7KUU9_VARDE|nr:V-type proton ATPase 116 kDa subunit a-like isoform X2 [Varroa destructor]XP_022706505.1 V-type proton ATPase 116 kDa subunit a-like isoform X2 [Varroa jacobsoni]
MGSLLRSEEMTLCQLFLQSEAAYACVAELGELGLVQFRDLNSTTNAFQRKFVNEVRRCDEMERKLRFLEREVRKDNLPMMSFGDNPEAPQPREMIDLEATFEKLENELNEVNTNAEALKKTFLELTELKHILKQTQQFFDEMGDGGPTHDEHTTLLGEDARQGQPQNVQGAAAMKLGFVAGVILRERLPSFERLLWRVCHGNVFLRQCDIDVPLEDPSSWDRVYKSVFIIFFQGDQLKAKVKKICESFRATLYPCPDTPIERREMSVGVMTRIEDLNTVLRQTQDHRHRVLAAAAKNIQNWVVKVRKIKAIYHTLNLFNLDVTQKCLIAEAWCAVGDIDRIQYALRRGTEKSGSSVPCILNRMDTKETPPTYNRTNKFTAAFQMIVDAYGVASYREMNPTPFTIVTFPFLFAVMFGDCGHGLIMFLFALWMVLKEQGIIAQKSKDEMWNTFFGGRYIILLMGAFSIYTGLIYNDCFSKSLNVIGSHWNIPAKDNYSNIEMLDPAKSYTGTPYPFGLDPIWQLATNKIPFINSYKMKVSVVLGVMQMTFGVVLSFYNHRFFQNRLSILCEFIPQMIFLMSIFGYLVLCILGKWMKVYENTSCAPSLLLLLINMVMFNYPKESSNCLTKPFYPGQQIVQTLLVLAAFICVPWILLSKPLILRKMWLAQNGQYGTLQSTNTVQVQQKDETQITYNEDGTIAQQQPVAHETVVNNVAGGHDLGHGVSFDHFEFGEILITQTIHTIEFCLGAVSHTASYLRLWALSLAHSQLSEVLWNMVLRMGLAQDGWQGGVILFVMFGFWACLTVMVLLLMEGLSAFLHALRLHWVEFQSKFYHGEGYLFSPFSFESILKTAEQEDATTS